MVFAIYTLAMTSVSSSECSSIFSESRSSLLERYRIAALRALVLADIFTTRDFEVLQALVLYLFSDTDSKLSLSLIAIASRIAQCIGLPPTTDDPSITVFETEMRVRLWWQFRGLEICSVSLLIPHAKPPFTDHTGIRAPLNVNDADLHPAMAELPVAQPGPTEMLFPLIKFEAIQWIQTSLRGKRLFQSLHPTASIKRLTTGELNETIDDLQRHIDARFTRFLDDRIPLHFLALNLIRSFFSNMRLKANHPRKRLEPKSSGGDSVDPHEVDQEELDAWFDSALQVLESRAAISQTVFSSRLYAHMAGRLDMDALIYVLSDLRQPQRLGAKADKAWKLVGQIYSTCQGSTFGSDSSFCVAMGDLVLEAWNARVQEPRITQDIEVPPYIQTLQAARATREGGERHSLDELVRPEMIDWDDAYWGTLYNVTGVNFL
ncbi:Fungal specific transcription factor domain [Geosmithia morbida]|uniref:Fungal specific transcription factor domain n=1 Tax=Geosmithia morbida TaxID=1094350 RepID=A0A9P5D346_9HYPO|nr:Fungal specific transcription factor domain [Geosmithia morbida]KAF4122161.1 Fungal specific transcription factor domain [Geosmithia morbida]